MCSEPKMGPVTGKRGYGTLVVVLSPVEVILDELVDLVQTTSIDFWMLGSFFGDYLD